MERRALGPLLPVRAAAILNMKLGHDKDYVRLAYDSLIHSNISSMAAPVRVLAQQYMSGKIVSVRGFDLFCRAQRAFNSKDSGINTRSSSRTCRGRSP
jgi:hypothetical protein